MKRWRQRRVFQVVIATLVAGVAAVVLFDGSTWGLNFLLFNMLTMVLSELVVVLQSRPRDRGSTALASGVVLFSASFALRDSGVLNSLALCGILLCGYLAFLRGGGVPVARILPARFLSNVSPAARFLFATPGDLLSLERRWLRRAVGGDGTIAAVGRGLLVSIGPLLVFGYLLSSSDLRFAKVAEWAFDWNYRDAMFRAFRFLAGFSVVGCILRARVLGRRVTVRDRRHSGSAAAVELGTVLAIQNLLFLTYLVVQFSYFFGGNALVQGSPASASSLTYAQYARRGFFELVGVAALALPMVGMVIAGSMGSSAQAMRRVRFLGAMTIVLVGFLEVSAMHRMYLYTEAYGLTELRFYTSIFMVWICFQLAWMAETTLTLRRERYPMGAVASALAMIGFLLIVSPDNVIASTNLARADRGKGVDVSYLSLLSADAVPAMAAACGHLGRPDRKAVEKMLRGYRQGPQGWRSWNWSRQRAHRTLHRPLCVPLRPG